jgi:sulfite reductase (ferredoxin)
MFYKIPDDLTAELEELDSDIKRFQNGEIDAETLKVRRVPFGCYEQRKDGTFMVRARATGGALTPSQLRTIAELSARYGSAAIHITTRQEFQIHDVALDDVLPILRALQQARLPTLGGGGNMVRNIIVSPDAGTASDEVFDPSPYAFALTSRLIAEPRSWLLRRKYKMAFSNSAADTAYAQFNDLGFIAKLRDGEKGFRVYVAGGLGFKPEVGRLLHDFIPAGDVYLVASAVERLFDQCDNRKGHHAARLRFVWNTLGEERFRQLYKEQLQLLREENPAPFVIEEIPEPKALLAFAPVKDQSPEFDDWCERYVEAQRQPGLVSVLVPVFLGNLKNEDALRLADFLEPFGDQVLRASIGQNLRIRNLPRSYLGNVYHLLREFAGLASKPRLLGNSIACTGADTCRLGICLSKDALTAVVEALANSGLDLDQIPGFRLNLSGCPNTCGQNALADLGFSGYAGRKEQQTYPAYVVVAGAEIGDGKARLARQIDKVKASDLPRFVCEVIELWLDKKEGYSSFAAFIDGEGTEQIRAIAGRFREGSS